MKRARAKNAAAGAVVAIAAGAVVAEEAEITVVGAKFGSWRPDLRAQQLSR